MTAVLGANVAVGVSAGSHVCALFSSDAERRQLVQAFLSGRPRDRLLYVGDSREPLQVDAGVEVRDWQSLYLAEGRFDAHRVLGALRDSIAETMQGGARRLRVAADMSWAVGDATDAEELASYEAAANALFQDGTAAALCLYDRRRFSTADLELFASAHPFTAEWARLAGSPAFTVAHQPDGTLHLLGEIDYFGAAHLAAVLADGPDRRDDLVIDVSKVRFIDVAALHALREAAAALPGSHRVVLRSPSRLVRKLVALLPETAAGRLVTRD